MKPKKKPKLKASSRKKSVKSKQILAVTMFFVWGGATIACVVMTFFYYTYPATKNSKQALVAGENSVLWYRPVLKSSTFLNPQVSAEAGILIDADSAEILWAKNQNQPRSVASLTKLVTSLAFLKTNPNLQEFFKVPSNFNNDGKELVESGDSISSLKLTSGDKITYKDLLFSALISSANNSALALANKIGEGQNLASQLTTFAKNSGAINANFNEGSGLDSGNIASAMDMSILLNVALKNEIISQALNLPSYTFQTQNGQRKTVVSTDKLLNSDGYQVMGGKTGYLKEAGYNLAIKAIKNNHNLILVLLGCPTTDDRFAGADSLLKWGFDGHDWLAQRQ